MSRPGEPVYYPDVWDGEKLIMEDEESLYLLWFARYLAHEKGINVDDDENFGPWDEEDERLAEPLRKAARA